MTISCGGSNFLHQLYFPISWRWRYSLLFMVPPTKNVNCHSGIAIENCRLLQNSNSSGHSDNMLEGTEWQHICNRLNTVCSVCCVCCGHANYKLCHQTDYQSHVLPLELREQDRVLGRNKLVLLLKWFISRSIWCSFYNNMIFIVKASRKILH